MVVRKISEAYEQTSLVGPELSMGVFVCSYRGAPKRGHPACCSLSAPRCSRWSAAKCRVNLAHDEDDIKLGPVGDRNCSTLADQIMH